MELYCFDHYFEYNELTAMLNDLRAEYPSLIKIHSICTTPENREVWACEISTPCIPPKSKSNPCLITLIGNPQSSISFSLLQVRM